MLSNTNSKEIRTKYEITSLLEWEGNFLILSFSNFQMYDSDPTDNYFGLRTFRLLLFFNRRNFIMIFQSKKTVFKFLNL